MELLLDQNKVVLSETEATELRGFVRRVGGDGLLAKVEHRLTKVGSSVEISGVLSLGDLETSRLVSVLRELTQQNKRAGLVIGSNIERALVTLGAFFDSNISRMLILDGTKILEYPKENLAIRLEIDSKLLYVSQIVFHAWIGDDDALTLFGDDIIEREVLMSLGAGTFLEGPPQICDVVNLKKVSEWTDRLRAGK